MSAVVELAQQLIAAPSITPHDNGCQQILINHLEKIGFQCESFKFAEVNNFWARIGNQSPLFVFAGHTDVVPPGPLEDWDSPPFQPAIRDNQLYGRGAADMKCAIAAMVSATEEFISHHSTFKGSIGFLITGDEEGPAVNGTQKVLEILQQRNEKIDYCLVGEPSSDAKIADQIRVGRRGSLHGKLTIHGKQGHVAHPHLALNPIHHSMRALAAFAETKWDEGNQDFPPTTLQITNMHSGTGAANVIPGHLELIFNFRFSPASTVSQLQKRTEEILKKHHLRYDLTWSVSAEPFLSKKATLLDIAQTAIKKICGVEAKTSTGGGTSDARFIVKSGAQTIELGLLNLTAHQVNENIAIADLRILSDVYLNILKGLFKD